jgi:hypothetical protein
MHVKVTIARKVLAIALLLCLALPLAGQQDQERKPSTPEERQRFVSITRKLEQDPLDEKLYADRKWAMDFLMDIPDITVSSCWPVLGNLAPSQYRYKRELVAQFALEMMAFIIEHPKQVNDVNAQYLAGVEGALRAYRSILKTQPTAASAAMESLAERQSQGKLDAYVRERAQACEGGDQATSWHR